MSYACCDHCKKNGCPTPDDHTYPCTGCPPVVPAAKLVMTVHIEESD